MKTVYTKNIIGIVTATVTGSGIYDKDSNDLVLKGCSGRVLHLNLIGFNAIDSYACKLSIYFKSITMSDTITSIGDGAFWNCNSLVSVKMPKNITTISYGLFVNCVALVSIIIPDFVTSIGDAAFHNCNSLVYVKMPNSVTIIYNSAFFNCLSLTSIKLSNSLNIISNSSFYNCRGLTSITIPSSVTSIHALAFVNCINLKTACLLEPYKLGLTAPSNGNVSFYGTSLKLITLPNSPTGVTATPGNQQANVSWNVPISNGGSPITSYTVTTYNNDGDLVKSDTDIVKTSATISGLTNGISYTFKVQAVNLAGNSVDSTNSPYVTVYSVPSSPLNVRATPGNQQANVSWNVPISNGGSPITSYTVTTYNNEVLIRSDTDIVETSITISDLTNGISYDFKVQAVNLAGNGLETTASVTPCSVPSSPTDVNASPGIQQANVSWNVPISNGGSPITSYTVTTYNNDGNLFKSDTDIVKTSATISGLTNGISYTFKVQAVNLAGNSVDSTNSPYVTLYSVPSSPLNVRATPGNQQANVSWNVPISNGGSPITSYTVTTYNNEVLIRSDTDIVETSITISGLTNGISYDFKVQAVNLVGNGLETTASVTPYSVPNSPIGVTATPGNQYAMVYWSAPVSNGESPITSYTVTTYNNEVLIRSDTDIVETSITISDLTNEISYTVKVEAVNLAGNSAVSTTSVTPYAVPYFPLNVTATPGNQKANVSWNVPISNGGSPITSYTVTTYNNEVLIRSDTDIDKSAEEYYVRGLTNGTAYRFVVESISEDGYITYSSITPEVIPFSADYTNDNDVITLTVTGSGTYIGNFKNDINRNKTNIVILNGYTVIGIYAFYRQFISSVLAPFATNIVYAAFGGCKNLTSVSLPSATNIGNFVFLNCYNLTSVSLPSATNIGDSVFLNCYNLTSVSLPSATNIGDSMFSGCYNLTSVSLPSATNIGNYMFSGCYNLTSVSLPSATNIHDYAFAGSNLTIVYLKIPNNYLGILNESYEPVSFHGAVVKLLKITDPVPVPKDVTATAGDKQASVSWVSPTNYEIPITSYIVNTYNNKIFIKSDTVINATSTTISGLTACLSYTFKVISVSSSRRSFESNASPAVFPYSIVYNTSNGVTTAIVTGSGCYTGEFNNDIFIKNKASIVVLNIYTSLGENAFANNSTLSRAVKSFNFKDFTLDDFNSVSLLDKVNDNEMVEFFGLTSISLPDVTIIGAYAFSGCSSLISISANTATDIGDSVFSGCSNIISISLPAVTNVGDSVFSGCSNIISISLPAVTNVGDSVFSGCSNIISISLPAVTNVGDSVFSGCSNIISISLPAVTNVGDFVFSGCSLLDYIELTNVTIINKNTFDGSFFTTISIPSVIIIPEDAFLSCSTLTNIYLSTPIESNDPTNFYGANVKLFTITYPDPPTDVTGTAGNKQVTLFWNKPINFGGSPIKSYIVTAYNNENNIFLTVNDIFETSTIISDLVGGNTYTFKVQAKNLVGNSLESTDSDAITPFSVPDAPTDVTGTAGDQQISLSWNKPTNDGGYQIDNYIVTVYNNENNIFFTINDIFETSTIISGLTNGLSYTFKVQAKNLVGNSLESTDSDAITPCTIPDSPTDVTGVAGDNQVFLSWNKPTNDGGYQIDSYIVTVYNNENNIFFTINDIFETSTIISGLTNGLFYTFKVQAKNLVGNSLESTDSDAITPCATVPDAPTDVTGVAGDNQVFLSWNKPTNDGGYQIDNYIVTVYNNENNIFFTINDIFETSTIISGLTNGLFYTFKVQAKNLVGNSLESTDSDAITPCTIPDSPTDVTGTAGDQQIFLSWNKPTNDGGYQIDSYKIGMSTDSGSTFTYSRPIPPLTTYTATGLTAGNSYMFKVIAVNIKGDSVPSTDSGFIIPYSIDYTTDENEVVTATVTGSADYRSEINAVVFSGNTNVTKVILLGYTSIGDYVFKDSTALMSISMPDVISIGENAFHNCSNLTKVFLSELNGLNLVVPSSYPVSFYGKDRVNLLLYTVPDAPTDVTGIADDNQVFISWTTPIGNGGPEITSYKIGISIDYGTTFTYYHHIPPLTTYTATGLTAGNSYMFKVIAVNMVGESASTIAIDPRDGDTLVVPSCFNEGTKILCLNKEFKEEYIQIENLRKCDLVKTFKHGYRKIDLIGKNFMINIPKLWHSCMYKMVKTEENGLLEDLIITGGHSILVDHLLEHKEKNDALFGGESQKIDDKYLLLSCVSKDFVKLENNDKYTYYHLTLENNGNDEERFGIWANGILSETPSKKHFNEHDFILL